MIPHFCVWSDLPREGRPLFHQQGRLYFPGQPENTGCPQQRSKKFIREQTAKLVSPYLQHLLSVLPVSVWHLIKICNNGIRLLFSLPQWAIKWSFINKLPACHKPQWLLLWDKRVLQGLSCKTSWSNICSYSAKECNCYLVFLEVDTLEENISASEMSLPPPTHIIFQT